MGVDMDGDLVAVAQSGGEIDIEMDVNFQPRRSARGSARGSRSARTRATPSVKSPQQDYSVRR